MKIAKSHWLQATIGIYLTAVTMSPHAGWAQAAGRQSADYELVADYKLGAPNFWDYLTYDAATKRLYASHIDRVEVIDTNAGKSVGQVGPFHDVHGIAIVSELGKGYAASGDDAVVKVFNLADLSIVKTIKVSVDADGAIYDPTAKVVLVVAGDSKNLTLIDVTSDTVTRTVPLPGKPEYLAIDGHGHVYVNIADHPAIARIDIASGAVSANWPLSGCEDPHGLAYDRRSDRLFSGCANQVMLVVDAANGKSLASLPIGPKSDAIVVDSARHRAMSANADGTLTVVSIGDGDAYSVERTVLTFFGGRNATIDDSTGTIFVSHGNMKLMTGTRDLTKMRFGWDGLDVAVLKAND